VSEAQTPAPEPGPGPAPGSRTDAEDTLEHLRAELDAVEELPLAERAARFEAINETLAAELGRLDGV
jgi:hypothetical protein